MWHDRYHLKDAVLDGEIPFNKAYGMTAFEYHGTDPRFNKVFNQGMSNHSTITMKKILETYNGFDGLKTVVDVGGGTGATLNMIVSKYPSIKGINFDLPHVIEDAPSYPGLFIVAKCMLPSIYYISELMELGLCLIWCYIYKYVCRSGACWWGHVCECAQRGCHLHEGNYMSLNYQNTPPFD